MKLILTKRFLGLIAYSALTYWMVFYGDMASKIIGVSAACAVIVIMAYRIEDLLEYIAKLEKNIEYGKFGKDGISGKHGSGTPNAVAYDLTIGTIPAPDVLKGEKHGR